MVFPSESFDPRAVLETVDRERCTLCMACASVCPGKALQAGGEKPELQFIEDNCVQCGLCARSCPENAVAPSPRFLFDAALRRQARVLSRGVEQAVSKQPGSQAVQERLNSQ